ncbi:protein disulfide-isomerase TMX3 [Centruroides vittatus]|uniref:protein disulfide-isomerase TMX3 n=1 Tax=Centruroides vittatus TaxID=120091 RepID=UPI00350EAE99
MSTVALQTKLFILGLYCVVLIQGNRVSELSDRFLELRNEGVWLVMFYAPWCGHCKNLEPIWNQVAQSLVDLEIRVGRVDCTRFTNVATEFGVHGFPTILFIKGHKTVEYKGDRVREEIVEFAWRMDGPPVRHFPSCDEFHNARNNKKVFFLYVDGNNLDQNVALKDEYTRIAEEFQPLIYFYTAPTFCLSRINGFKIPTKASVYVFKDKTSFKFDEEEGSLKNITLREWINWERFPAFLKITHGNFYQLLKSGKNIAIAVLEENLIGGLSMKMREFKDVVEAIATNNRDRYHEYIIFGWLGQPDLANSVAMMSLSVPNFIIINSVTYQYYMPPVIEDEKVPSPQTMIALLDQVINKSAPAYGGDTMFYRLYRAYFEAKTSLMSMWKGNPLLTTLLLGLPLGLLSIICYTSCCSDILEAEDEEPPYAQSHEKKE